MPTLRSRKAGSHPPTLNNLSSSTEIKEENDEDDKKKSSVGKSKKQKKSAIALLKENQLKGISRHFVTAAKVLLAMLIVPPFLNYAALQREGTQLKPEGELYDIGWNQKLYLECKGTGAPTVMLEAPTGMNSDVWSLVIEKLAKNTRVCVYDRAGLGFSERPSQNFTVADGTESKSNQRNKWQPFTAERMVDDLHQLITVSSDQHKPFLLVGAELGALVAQFYAQLYENDVMGLVLINPLSDDLFLQDDGIWAYNWFQHVIPSYQTIQLGAALGLTRFALMLKFLNHPLYMAEDNGLSETTIQRQKYLLCNPKHLSSVVDEHFFINETFSQFRTVRMLKGPPKNLPVTIMTGNYYDEQMPGKLNKAWAKSERNLISNFYPGAQHIVVNGGDRHMIYKNPSAIAEPINRAVRLWNTKQQKMSQKTANAR